MHLCRKTDCNTRLGTRVPLQQVLPALAPPGPGSCARAAHTGSLRDGVRVHGRSGLPPPFPSCTTPCLPPCRPCRHCSGGRCRELRPWVQAGCSRGRLPWWCRTPEITGCQRGRGHLQGTSWAWWEPCPSPWDAQPRWGSRRPKALPVPRVCCAGGGEHPECSRPAALPLSAREHRKRQRVMFLIVKLK